MTKSYYKGLTRLEMAIACRTTGIFECIDVCCSENVDKYEAARAIQVCKKAGVIKSVSWGKYKVC